MGGDACGPGAWVVSDELWELVEPLLPSRERRSRYPGRRRLPDRQCLQGILYVLHTGIPWHDLPPELGLGSGVTCWRRLEEWQRAGVWERLHRLLLNKLRRRCDRLSAGRSTTPTAASFAGAASGPRSPRRQTAHGSGLGRVRWPVERSLSWLHQFRRLLVRFSGGPICTRRS